MEDRKHKIIPIFFISLAVLVAAITVAGAYYDRSQALNTTTIFKVWLSCHSSYPFILIVYLIPFPVSMIVGALNRDNLMKLDWIRMSYLSTVFLYSIISFLMYLSLQFIPNATRTFHLVDFIILNLNFVFVSSFITSVAIIVNHRVKNNIVASTLTLLICFAVDRLAYIVYITKLSIIRVDNTLIVAMLPVEQPILINIFSIYSAVLAIVAMNFFVVFGERS